MENRIISLDEFKSKIKNKKCESFIDTDIQEWNPNEMNRLASILEDLELGITSTKSQYFDSLNEEAEDDAAVAGGAAMSVGGAIASLAGPVGLTILGVGAAVTVGAMLIKIIIKRKRVKYLLDKAKSEGATEAELAAYEKDLSQIENAELKYRYKIEKLKEKVDKEKEKAKTEIADMTPEEKDKLKLESEKEKEKIQKLADNAGKIETKIKEDTAKLD